MRIGKIRLICCKGFESFFNKNLQQRKYDTSQNPRFWKCCIRPASFSNSPNEKLFIDVPEDAWYVKNLEKNIEIGLLSGYSDGTFDPQHNIHWWTLAQVLYNLTEGYPLTWWEDESIRDTSTQQMWSQSVMNFAMDYGLIPNSSEKKYAVEWPTRFQIIQSFYQLAIRTEAIEITQTRAMDWI